MRKALFDLQVVIANLLNKKSCVGLLSAMYIIIKHESGQMEPELHVARLFKKNENSV
jgi:hypothetical protein